MSFTNPNETWEEFDARIAANRKAGIAAETCPQARARRQSADTMATVAEQFARIFETGADRD